MAEYYIEDLPDDLAKTILDTKYDSNVRYQLVQDKEGTYITGINRETNERVDISSRSDGIPDDYELDTEVFDLIKEELELRDDETCATKTFGIWKYVALAVTLGWAGALIYFATKLF